MHVLLTFVPFFKGGQNYPSVPENHRLSNFAKSMVKKLFTTFLAKCDKKMALPHVATMGEGVVNQNYGSKSNSCPNMCGKVW
jgi:hypothetical protein